MKADQVTLQAIQDHFHEVIRSRAGDLVDEHKLILPDLGELFASDEPRAWFPIPGMYGGFSYWLEEDDSGVHLVSESWCRVAEGSGQRHIITAGGYELVDEGFV